MDREILEKAKRIDDQINKIETAIENITNRGNGLLLQDIMHDDKLVLSCWDLKIAETIKEILINFLKDKKTVLVGELEKL